MNLGVVRTRLRLAMRTVSSFLRRTLSLIPFKVTTLSDICYSKTSQQCNGCAKSLSSIRCSNQPFLPPYGA
jgi:hypothetical protein